MCRRFATVPVNVTGPSNEVCFGVAGQHIGLEPGGTPQAVRPSVGPWQAAIEAELAGLPAAGAADEPHFRVFALGVDAR